MEPLILITGEDEFDPKSHNPFYLIKRSYGTAVAGAGATAVMPLDPLQWAAYADMADGLLLTGGVDVHPARYNDIFMDYDPNSGLPAPFVISVTRDSMDILLCKAFLKAGKPIMGIGRGMQLINVVLGGTLVQDIAILMQQEHPIGKHHVITTTLGSKMNELLGTQTEVNSYHHMTIKTLGEGLQVAALSTDGLIEAIEHVALPVFAVQWHPETYQTNDEEVRALHAAVTEPIMTIDPIEVEKQIAATEHKKAIPGYLTDANVELPTDNALFNYFIALCEMGGK